MKFLVSIVLTALLAFASCLYLPWWTIGVAAFIVAVCIHQRSFTSFFTGFIGIFILWLILSLSINSDNHHILAPKISVAVGLGGSVFLIILITCIAGALVGGLAALTGSLLRKAFNQ